MPARILIVEDEGIVALDLHNRLARMGHEVVGVAASGEDAIAAARRHRPDLALMDIVIKGPVDGIGTAAAIRAELGIPAIYLTAHADAATLDRAKPTQPLGYLVKPFAERDLAVTLEMGLARAAAERELRQAQRALRGSEERFRLLAEAMPDLLFAADAEGRNTYTNARFRDYAGLAAGELLGDGWLRVLHPEDRERAAAAWAAAVRDGTPYEVEYRLRRADGEYRWFLGRGIPAPDAEGRTTAWFGTCTDIHDLKATAQALREGAEALRLSQDAARIGSYAQDLPGGALRWAPGAQVAFGFPPGREVMPLAEWRAACHPEDAVRVDAEREAALARGDRDVRHEHRILRPDTGALRHVEVRARHEHGAAGRPLRAFGVVIDVTERKAAEEHQLLLMREVDHRARNLLAVVQSMLRLTRAEGRQGYAETVEGRIAALGHAHTLLAKGRWTGAALREVAEADRVHGSAPRRGIGERLYLEAYLEAAPQLPALDVDLGRLVASPVQDHRHGAGGARAAALHGKREHPAAGGQPSPSVRVARRRAGRGASPRRLRPVPPGSARHFP